MKASVVDLRYKTSDIMKALDRNESVTVLYHGKVRGVIKPAREKTGMAVKDHPLFAILSDSTESVLEELGRLREERYAV